MNFRRRPAWTDRILYKVRTETFEGINLNADQSSYKSHPNYILSDHKPVTSEFTIKVNLLFFQNFIAILIFNFKI